MSSSLTLDVHASVRTLPSGWDTVVSNSPLGSVFARTEWLRAIERGTDLTPRHVVVLRDGTPIGLCPNFVSEIALPIPVPSAVAPRELVSIEPGFGGPILTGEYGATLDRLLEGVRTAATGGVWGHRIRTLSPAAVQYADLLDARGYVPSVLTCQLLVDLTRPIDAVFDAWSKERRRTARKARDAGMTVAQVEPSATEREAFYDAYAAMIDRVDGVRYPPAFFEALHETMGERIVLFRADIDDDPVGWHFYVRDEERGSLHHFFSGLREEHFGHHPSSRLHEAAMEWASDAGFGTYNFGESNAAVTDGGFRYKSQYGGDVLPVVTWERGIARGRWAVYRAARRLYRTAGARAARQTDATSRTTGGDQP
ncbi:Peptidoglycan interpeptide bridge formation enzyme, contains acetyltransferase domain of GNAT superfamily [Halapricum desulfuricans]|uniref:Peptidoglycan interpeptide bridge formation enzyme, contains acetyltransferase domain of GNAT superfamily n=1 Tax=Halapricum desulfuricans TaxID=2841257 RepID=A0A897NG80_9EURY|nr:GNAT family N-acetyltransferase [Halapricum desulfuricans]QSG11351.1 Peptidoglycan interpeptide bridge formation enzyme, contains acetyltransferase domain of GNAT superfamily [Halapricum desulfuricans]